MTIFLPNHVKTIKFDGCTAIIIWKSVQNHVKLVSRPKLGVLGDSKTITLVSMLYIHMLVISLQ